MLISLNSKNPIFEQIVSQIIVFIDAGVLSSDEKLPSVRELAVDLSINPNTVARAYMSLEEQGYIYSLNKKGYFIKKQTSKKENKDAQHSLLEAFLKAEKDGLSKFQIEEVFNRFVKGEN
jgi:GntR family transcriptional regulator